MATPAVTAPVTPTPTALRANALGARDITFMVVSAAAPLTVMAGVAPLGVLVGGVGAPAGYLVAGLVLLLFASGFTAMAAEVSAEGGFYAYIVRGLGRPAGLAAALLALVSYNTLQIGIYGLLGSAAAGTVTAFTGVDVPWPVFALVAVAVVALLGHRGVDVGAKVLAVLLTAETAILVVLVVGVFTSGRAGSLSLSSFSPHAVLVPGMGAVLALAFAAYSGFESTAIYRAEARDPARTIPRATYAAVIFLGVFYCFVVWTVIQAFGDQRVVGVAAHHVTDLFFVASDRFVGRWASDLMRVLLVTSILAALLAFHNACNRYAHSLAREGVLPAALGRTHPRFRTPTTAAAVQTVLAVVVVGAFALAGADPYLQLLLWVNTPGGLGLLLLQAMTAAAVVGYFWRDHRGHSAWRVVVAPIASTVLLVTIVVLTISKMDLMTAAGPVVNTVLVGVVPVVLALGFALAPVLRRRRPEAYRALGGAGGADASEGVR